MQSSHVALALCFTAIPLWYGYRTISDKQVRRFDLSIFLSEYEQREKEQAEKKTREEEKALADRNQAYERGERLAEENRKLTLQKERARGVQGCLSNGRSAEAEYRELVEEQKRFRSFTQSILNSPVPQSTKVETFQFTVTIEDYMRIPSSDSAIKGHVDAVQVGMQRCQEFGSASTAVTSIYVEVMGIESAQNFFRADIQRLQSARSKIAELMKYAKGELPDTVQGRITELRVSSDIDRALTTPRE